MAFYSVRSERLFCEQLDYNLMFRWFLDMNMVEDSFDHSIFSLNRERANFRKTRFRGIERTQQAAHLNGAAYNLLRIAKLIAAPI